MTDTAQPQHATQGSHIDPLPNHLKPPPSLQPIDSGYPLSKYGVTCRVDSVYYYEKSFGDGSMWDATCAAVVLEVGFDLADAEFRYALVPFLVQDISDLNVYPDGTEIVEKSAKRYMLLTHYKIIVQEGRGAEVVLQFCNKRGKYFPPSVKVLLVTSKFGVSLPFKFTLQMLPSLQVIVKARSWWRFWMTTLRPEKGHRGWSCGIEADYCPDLAKHILSQDPNRRDPPRLIGLHPAAASYLEQLRKPSSS